jgi:hypothetical protein
VEKKCPLKQNFFLWMCFRGQIQSAASLSLKGWAGNVSCVSCGALEDVDHIIFRCPIAVFVWCFLREVFGKSVSPTRRDDFSDIFLRQGGDKYNSVWWFMAAAIFWSLWLTRNDRVFLRKVPSSLVYPLYKVVFLMLQWKPLVGSKHLQQIEEMVLKIETALKSQSP